MTRVLRAEDAVYGGYVISRADGVVFIKGAIPGEAVEVTVTEKKRDYTVAEVTGIVEPSDHRVDAPCPHFGDCGGCQLQFVAYPMQVEMKNDVLRDCLRRIGGMEPELDPPLAGPPFGYRRRAQFKVSRDGELGFFREGTRQVVPIDSCPLMTNEINSALARIQDLPLDDVREVHLTHGDALMALVKGRDFDESLAEAFIQAGMATVAFQDESHRGEGFVTLPLGDLSYTVSPWTFLQANWDLSVALAELVAGEAAPAEDHRVVDFYAGAGHFSLSLAGRSAGVVAVEENPHAIKDGKRNVSLNKVKGFTYARGTAETARMEGPFHTAIIDPPRPGLSNHAMDRVLQLAPERIVYVSCNPSTLARDLRKLVEHYALDSIRMADLFPNSYHVEAVAVLTRASEGTSHAS
jgi:23S rRNA (uracil1939-C5)-methyltransferase